MAHILTPEGKAQLEEKLQYYKTVRRKEVAKKIGEAREFGDLSENAEYEAAREEQTQIESEIREMEEILLTCEIADSKSTSGKVVIGSTVKLYDEEFDETLVYKILGSTESDPENGIISNNSPVGSALLGKKKGETVKVRTNNDEITYKILEVK
jgi:transcription elongation factor GreA